MEARLIVHITLVGVPLFTEQEGPMYMMQATKMGLNKTEESLRIKQVQDVQRRGGKRRKNGHKQEEGLNQTEMRKVEEKSKAYLERLDRGEDGGMGGDDLRIMFNSEMDCEMGVGG